MKRYFFVAVLLTPLMSMTASGAECIAEMAPTLPDGKTATAEEMKTAQREVKAYMANSEAFLACLDERDEKATDLERKQTSAIYNATVKEMRQIGVRFNAEARTFNKSKR